MTEADVGNPSPSWKPKAGDFEPLQALFWDMRALHPETGLRRFYTLRVLQNLFGDWELIVHHGRIGTRGRTRRLFFEDPATLPQKLAAVLRKRLNAKARLGVNYVIVETNYTPPVPA